MGADRAVVAARSPRGAPGRRPSGDQRHHAHAAFGGALAGLPCGLWPVHDNLQPLQPMEPQGIWAGMFYALTGSTGMMGTVAVDSTHIKAHRSAAGAKGGPSVMPSGARAAAGRPRSTP